MIICWRFLWLSGIFVALVSRWPSLKLKRRSRSRLPALLFPIPSVLPFRVPAERAGMLAVWS